MLLLGLGYAFQGAPWEGVSAVLVQVTIGGKKAHAGALATIRLHTTRTHNPLSMIEKGGYMNINAVLRPPQGRALTLQQV
jgi:hypothetical protein